MWGFLPLCENLVKKQTTWGEGVDQQMIFFFWYRLEAEKGRKRKPERSGVLFPLPPFPDAMICPVKLFFWRSVFPSVGCPADYQKQ